MLRFIARVWKGLRKPITWERVGFWSIILLGRQLECVACGRKMGRTFPLIHRGKLYLLGIRGVFVRPVFDLRERLGFQCLECVSRAATEAAVAAESRCPKLPKPARIFHVVLGHTPPEHIEPLLSYMQDLAPEVPVMLVYGGTLVNFETIRWEKKVFCADPNLRGPANDHNHIELFKTLARFTRDTVSDDDWVLYTEADCIPLRKNYPQEVVRLANLAGADLAACKLHNQTGSNADWYQLAIQNPEWLGVIAANSCRVSPDQIYHFLGCLLLARAGFFQRWLEYPHPKCPVYFETHVPTLAYHLGLKLVNLCDLSDQFGCIRYRPPFEAESLPEALEKGAWFIHPAKWGAEQIPRTE